MRSHRIRVNVICPGAIETDISENTEQRNLEQIRESVDFPEGKIPLTDGKSGTSEQVAQLVLFLSLHQMLQAILAALRYGLMERNRY